MELSEMINKSITGWAALVPGTMEPMSTLQSEVARGTRQYVIFCDPDAKAQAEQAVLSYPEGQRFVKEVVIIEKRKLFKRKPISNR